MQARRTGDGVGAAPDRIDLRPSTGEPARSIGSAPTLSKTSSPSSFLGQQSTVSCTGPRPEVAWEPRIGPPDGAAGGSLRAARARSAVSGVQGAAGGVPAFPALGELAAPEVVSPQLAQLGTRGASEGFEGSMGRRRGGIVTGRRVRAMARGRIIAPSPQGAWWGDWARGTARRPVDGGSRTRRTDRPAPASCSGRCPGSWTTRRGGGEGTAIGPRGGCTTGRDRPGSTMSSTRRTLDNGCRRSSSRCTGGHRCTSRRGPRCVSLVRGKATLSPPAIRLSSRPLELWPTRTARAPRDQRWEVEHLDRSAARGTCEPDPRHGVSPFRAPHLSAPHERRGARSRRVLLLAPALAARESARRERSRSSSTRWAPGSCRSTPC